MPDDRLQRTRDAYVEVGWCGHQNQMLGQYEVGTDPDGVTRAVRVPQKFRVRGPDARFCVSCLQVVDTQDDQEATLNAGEI